MSECLGWRLHIDFFFFFFFLIFAVVNMNMFDVPKIIFVVVIAAVADGLIFLHIVRYLNIYNLIKPAHISYSFVSFFIDASYFVLLFFVIVSVSIIIINFCFWTFDGTHTIILYTTQSFFFFFFFSSIPFRWQRTEIVYALLLHRHMTYYYLN